MGNSLILLIKSVFIAVIEGITEFLPISSTGHMIITGHFIDFTGSFATLFEIVIQLGAVLAIVVLYRKKIFGSFRHLKPGDSGFQFWGAVVIGFIPSGILGFFFHDIIEQYMFFPLPVAGALLVGGVLMIVAERKFRKQPVHAVKQLTVDLDEDKKVSWKQAVIIGLFQCLALIWPGFSRSASTIIGGWIVGLSTVAAAEFSFFLALPTMIIASGYSLLKMDIQLSGAEVLSLIVGFVVAFVVALLVVERFIRFLKQKPMRPFAIYRIGLGLIILIMAMFKVL